MRGLGQRYRQWYATLHPSLQMIGMQIWMPVFFVLGFCLCYLAPFTHVAPREVPVAVVGPVATMQAAADKAVPGALRFQQEPDVATAQHLVLRGEVAAAVDPSDGTVYVASSHQAQSANLLPRVVDPLLTAEGLTPALKDIAPLPAGDFGMGPMYLMLAWCIGGYLTAMFIGMMGGPLRHRTRIAVIVGLSFVLSFLSALLASTLSGTFHGHFAELWGLGWAWGLAIGLAVNGLSYFFGRFIAIPALAFFVFLSIPSSGAAFPQWFMPEPFAWLNHVVVGSGITEMLKRLVYGVGPGYSRGWIMLVCYAVGGLLLAWVGKTRWEDRRVRRVLAGRTTMFADAQRANAEQARHDRDEILARHGAHLADAAPGSEDEPVRGPGPYDLVLESPGLEGEPDDAPARSGSGDGSATDRPAT